MTTSERQLILEGMQACRDGIDCDFKKGKHFIRGYQIQYDEDQVNLTQEEIREWSR